MHLDLCPRKVRLTGENRKHRSMTGLLKEQNIFKITHRRSADFLWSERSSANPFLHKHSGWLDGGASNTHMCVCTHTHTESQGRRLIQWFGEIRRHPPEIHMQTVSIHYSHSFINFGWLASINGLKHFSPSPQCWLNNQWNSGTNHLIDFKFERERERKENRQQNKVYIVASVSYTFSVACRSHTHAYISPPWHAVPLLSAQYDGAVECLALQPAIVRLYINPVYCPGYGPVYCPCHCCCPCTGPCVSFGVCGPAIQHRRAHERLANMSTTYAHREPNRSRWVALSLALSLTHQTISANLSIVCTESDFYLQSQFRQVEWVFHTSSECRAFRREPLTEFECVCV